MEKTIVTTGKTIDLAIEAALTPLGLARDDVSVQVLAQAKPGFLGIGAAPAKVEVTYESHEAPKSALGAASRSKPKAKKVEVPKVETPKVETPKVEAPKKVETPICNADLPTLAGKKFAVVPILRAGLGLVEGVLRMVLVGQVR